VGWVPGEPGGGDHLPPPGGNTHAVFPYYQESTGRFYIFAGDEIIGRSRLRPGGGNNRAPYDPDVPGTGTPRNTAGYIHIVDFTDPENPKKVARYHVPEYGTHNIWVEDDILYQAYYEGGSGWWTCRGSSWGTSTPRDREIAVFKPNDPIGYVAQRSHHLERHALQGEHLPLRRQLGLWAVRSSPGRSWCREDPGARGPSSWGGSAVRPAMVRDGQGVGPGEPAPAPEAVYRIYVGAESADLLHRIRFGPDGRSVEASIPVAALYDSRGA
jgi:hypothetical protein